MDDSFEQDEEDEYFPTKVTSKCSLGDFNPGNPVQYITNGFGHALGELYNHFGVYHGSCMHHFTHHDCNGTLALVRNNKLNLIFIEWRPSTEVNCESDAQEPEWSLVTTKTKKPRTLSSSSDSSRGERVRIPLSKVKTFRLNRRGKCVSIKLRDEKFPSEFFTFITQNGSLFVSELCKHTPAIKSSRDSDLYRVIQDNEQDYHTHNQLAKSFSELQLEHTPASRNIWQFFTGVREDPVGATKNILCKVSDTFLFRGEQRPEEASELLTQSLTREIGEDLQSGEGSTSNDEYEVIHRAVTIELDNCVLQPRGAPLTLERWTQGMDAEGRITDSKSIKKLVFRGGIADDLRSEVWKFILGVYPWTSTHDERGTIRKKNVESYVTMKRQWESMTQVQKDNFSDFRDRESLIGKDVHRTDRALPFFAGDDNPNVKALENILMTYVMYNFDLGYVQGMSDLLAPLLELFKSEVDAFWCFVGFMDRVGSNFDLDQEGMKQQLLNVRTLIAFLDPNLLNYLDRNDSGNMFFCFRWLIVLFKREFSRDDVMRIWEVLWSDLPCKNFQLLLCVAILETEKFYFYKNNFSFNEILKHVNELSLHIDLENMISKAEGIYQLLIEKADELPDCVRVILGLPPLNLHLWVPSPVPLPGGQSEERSPTRNGTKQPNHSGAGEPGTSGRAASPGSDSASIETLPTGTDPEDSFEKAISLQYF